jgi:hypothetical protein
VLGPHLGVVAVRLNLYNRARNDAANTYERPAREVGGGIEFKHPCAAKNARGAPSVKRRDHLLLLAFAWVVHNEEGCHKSAIRKSCGTVGLLLLGFPASDLLHAGPDRRAQR